MYYEPKNRKICSFLFLILGATAAIASDVPPASPKAESTTAAPSESTSVEVGPLCWERPRGSWFHSCFCKPCKKGPKTLFEWTECEDPCKEENGKNGNGEKKEDEPEEVDRITTDRPDFTEASSTVGLGRVQLETGYTYFRDNEFGVRNRLHSYPEALLRIGMFAEWFELRIGQNIASERNIDLDGSVFSSTGAQDLYLGVKLGLTEQKKFLPEMALVLQMTVPTGHPDFTSDEVLPGFNFIFGWDVIEDCLTLAGSFGINRAIDDSGHYYAHVHQSITVGYTICANLNAYTEWFAFYPNGSIDPLMTNLHHVNGGFQYFVNNNCALDIRVGTGLNKHSADFFSGVGLSVRY